MSDILSTDTEESFLDNFDPSKIENQEPTDRQKEEQAIKKNILDTARDFFNRNYEYAGDILRPGVPMSMVPGITFMKAREGVSNAQDARNSYLKEKLGENMYSPGVNTIKKYLDDTETNSGLQFAYGFADNIDQVRKGLESRLSTKPDGTNRKIDIFTDDRQDKPWYMPKYYTSVEDDNGNMTPYSNPLQTTQDFVARVAGQVGFDLAASTVEYGPAIAAGLAASTITSFIPFIGPLAAGPVGAIAFLTTAYTSGATTTKIRNEFLKPVLGLTDEESKTWFDFLDVSSNMVTKNPAYQLMSKKVIPGVTKDVDIQPFEAITETTEEKINAILAATLPGIGRVFDKIKTASESLMRVDKTNLDDFADKKINEVNFQKEQKDTSKIGYESPAKVNVKGFGNLDIFKQMVKAQKAVQSTRPGGRFGFLGVPFSDFSLDMYTPSRIVGRLSSLSQQTSLVIPNNLKAANNNLTNFIESYIENRAKGTVNYSAFKRPYEELREFYTNLGQKKKQNFKNLGIDIKELDEAFDTLRYLENKVMYDEVFQIVGDAKFDLTPLRTRIAEVKTKDNIIPRTDESGKITYTIKRTDTYHLDKFIGDLLALGGKRDPDNPLSGMLDVNQSRKAVQAFFADNRDLLPSGPDGRKLRADAVQTPIQLIHTAAIMAGKLAYARYKGAPGKEKFPGANQAFNDAMDIRNVLLDMMKKPLPGGTAAKDLSEESVARIQPLLKDANKFFAETQNLRGISDSGTSFMDRLRFALDRREAGQEPGLLLPELVGSGRRAPLQRGSGVTTLENLKKQQEFFNKKIKEFDISKDFLDKYGNLTDTYTKLQDEFSHTLFQVLGYNTKQKLSDPKSPNFVADFFDGLEPDHLKLLGIDEATEKYFRDSAEDFEFIFDKKLMDLLATKSRNEKSNSLFHTVFTQDTDIDTNISRLLGTAVGKRDIPGGLTLDLPKRPTNPFTDNVATESQNRVRLGLFNYLFDPNSPSGLFKKAKENTANFDAGNIYIDMSKFVPILDKIRDSKELSTVLTPMDKEFLNVVEQVGYALEGAGRADAGTALAGAQIIGELFTIDGRKLLGGLGRLAAQNRLSKFLTNQKVINLIIGTAPAKRQVGYLERVVFGKGALGSLISQVVREESDDTTTQENQTQPEKSIEEIFRDAPGFSELNKQSKKLFAS